MNIIHYGTNIKSYSLCCTSIKLTYNLVAAIAYPFFLRLRLRLCRNFRHSVAPASRTLGSLWRVDINGSLLATGKLKPLCILPFGVIDTRRNVVIA